MNKIKKITAISMIAIMLAGNSAFLNDNKVQAEVLNQNLKLSYSPVNPYKADIQSQRIPVGTVIKIRMETPVNTNNSLKGDPFFATIIDDVKVNDKVLLPSGTIVRGSVADVVKRNFLSRGGEVTLYFDHIVTPIGRQVPVFSRISNCVNLSTKGNITAGGGYLNAVSRNLDQGVDIFTRTTAYGFKGGFSNSSGAPVILAGPICFFGGLIAGPSVFLGKSVYALVKRGDNVILNPADRMELTLIQPLDIPLN
ncbi:MAG: hypothetical protein PHC34_13460 [Candidatus Gastranaerophilales bacterium]|nr:hypothetical protein [Candidatus Gastranaerophilales bacterium]